MPKPRRKPVVIIVRDGWGSNPHPEWNRANAVYLAKTPVDEKLMVECPHGLIKTSGQDVGLPDGVMGNSEVGHQNIGAGRIVEQELMRITGRIHDGTFFENKPLLGAIERAKQTGGCLHLMGLCSNGRVHSDLNHLYALLDMTRRQDFPGERVFVHAFMDGRDTPPNEGAAYLEQIEAKCREAGVNPIASVVGRYWAMDRDNRWDRIQLAYDMLVGRADDAPVYSSADDAIRHYYQHPSEETMSGDEFVAPAITCGDRKRGRIQGGDSVIFFNFRGDRPRQLVKAFTLDEFPFQGERSKDGKLTGFDRGAKLDLRFVTMTAYEADLPVEVAFDKPAKMAGILGAHLSKLGLSQFRCAETEKYAHVTFFFNDYRDEPFPGEDRCLVPSPRDVSTYDQKPEMSAAEITKEVVRRIRSGACDVIVVNFANGDMVGHTGSLPAAIVAVETVDHCVGEVVDATREAGGSLIITADHGNCEQMIHPDTGGPHTAHTTYDVELIVVDDEYHNRPLRKGGRLADIAPTACILLGIDPPPEMTGQSLIQTKA